MLGVWFIDIVSIFWVASPAYNSVPEYALVQVGSNLPPLRSEVSAPSTHSNAPWGAPCGAVRTLPIVVVLPFRQEHVEINRCKVNGAVEFDLICFLRALDLPIQMRRSRLVGAKFDSILFQALLDDDSKEFTPPIRLNALNGERHFLKDTIKEIQRIIRSPAGIYAQNPITGTIQRRCIDICQVRFCRYPFAPVHRESSVGNAWSRFCGDMLSKVLPDDGKELCEWMRQRGKRHEAVSARFKFVWPPGCVRHATPW